MLTQMLGNIADDHLLPITSPTYTSHPQSRPSLSHAAMPPNHYSMEPEPWAATQNAQNNAPMSRPSSSVYQNQPETPMDLPMISPDVSVQQQQQQVSPTNNLGNPTYPQLPGARETAPSFPTRSTPFLRTTSHHQQHPHQFGAGLGVDPSIVQTAEPAEPSTPHGVPNSSEFTSMRIAEVYQNIARPYDYTQVSAGF
jgi:hypothetical protein